MALNERAGGHQWVENLLRPVMIAAMVTCQAAPLALGLNLFLENWESSYFLAFVFLAGLEAILSERLLHKKRIDSTAYHVSRGSELLVLLILLKLINYIPLGFEQLWTDALGWATDIDSLLTDTDLFTFVIFVPMWLISLTIAHQATELDVDEAELAPPPDKTSTEYYLWMTQPPLTREREQALTFLGETFIWGGITILVTSALIHIALPEMGAPAIPVLLYFALGVALLSQARFSVTQAGWRIQGIPIQAGITHRWLLGAVIFLVAVALGAALLPTNYALGPIQSLLYVLSFVVGLIVLGLNLLFFLLMLPLALLFPNMQQPERPAIPPLEELAADPAIATAQPPWLEALVSFLFWATVLAIIGYAVTRFLRDRFGVLAKSEEAQRTWWGRLLMWLRDLWQWWRAWRSETQAQWRQRRARLRAGRVARTDPFRFFSLGKLSPRELIRYFYVSTARRAAQVGRPRGPGQTPYEYQADLDEQFPDLEPDLTGLTDAFVQARYSPQLVQPEDAEAVKPLWQRIRAALRRRRFSRQPDSEVEYD